MPRPPRRVLARGLVRVLAALGVAGLVAANGLGGTPGGGGPSGDFVVEQTDVPGIAGAIAPLPDGGFVIAGGLPGEVIVADGATYALVEPQAFAARYPGEGKVRWFTPLDLGVHDMFVDAQADADGQVVAVGGTTASGPETWAWMVAFAPDGSVAWARNASVPGTESSGLAAVAVAPEGAIVAVGNARFRLGADLVEDVPFLVRVSRDGVVAEPELLRALSGWRVGDAAPAPSGKGLLLAGGTPWGEGCLAEVGPAGVAWQRCDREGSQGWAKAARVGDRVALGGVAADVPSTMVAGKRGAADWTARWNEGLVGAHYAVTGLAPAPGGGVVATVVNASSAPLLQTERFVEAMAAMESWGRLQMAHLRYTAEGRLAWVEEVPSLDHVWPLDSAVDAQGRLVVTGVKADAGQRFWPFVYRVAVP